MEGRERHQRVLALGEYLKDRHSKEEALEKFALEEESFYKDLDILALIKAPLYEQAKESMEKREREVKRQQRQEA